MLYVVFFSPSKQMVGFNLKLGHTNILPHSFQFIDNMSFNAIVSFTKYLKGIRFTFLRIQTSKTWFFIRILNKTCCYPNIHTRQRNSSVVVICFRHFAYFLKHCNRIYEHCCAFTAFIICRIVSRSTHLHSTVIF
jgi:hypothetical protein